MLKEERYKLYDGDWIGVYRNLGDDHPLIVACVGDGFRPVLTGEAGPVFFFLCHTGIPSWHPVPAVKASDPCTRT